VEDEELSFFLEIVEWKNDSMKLNMNFTNPLQVSVGNMNDQVVCTVKNRFLFVSSQSGKVLSEDRLELVKAIPRQVPKGVDVEALNGNAASTGAAMKGLMIIQLVA